MSKNISTKNFTSSGFKEFVIEHLAKCNNIELVILKGHVLIEYMLNHFIDKATNDNIDFENTRFSFSQKNYLFELLGDNIKELHDEINLVNKLRNDIAHRLTYNNQHLSTLLSNVGRKYNKITELQKDNQLMLALIATMTYICGTLYGHIESQSKKKEIITDFLNFIKKNKKNKSQNKEA